MERARRVAGLAQTRPGAPLVAPEAEGASAPWLCHASPCPRGSPSSCQGCSVLGKELSWAHRAVPGMFSSLWLMHEALGLPAARCGVQPGGEVPAL